MHSIFEEQSYICFNTLLIHEIHIFTSSYFSKHLAMFIIEIQLEKLLTILP